MKKILIFIAALFLLISVEGQILRYSNYTAPTPPEPEEPTNMISNGDFSNGTTGWNFNDTWTVVDGVLTFGGTAGGGQYVYQFAADLEVTFEPNTDYEIYIDAIDPLQPGSVQSFEFSIQCAGYVLQYEEMVAGTNHFTFTTGATVTSSTLILLEFKITSGGIDNIEIYKVE